MKIIKLSFTREPSVHSECEAGRCLVPVETCSWGADWLEECDFQVLITHPSFPHHIDFYKEYCIEVWDKIHNGCFQIFLIWKELILLI